MTPFLILNLLGCDLLNDLKSNPNADTSDEPLSAGSVYSSMPYASEQSRVDWNCDFLTGLENVGQTGLEEYGVIAIWAQGAANLYADAFPSSEWVLARTYPEIIDGEVEYDGLFYPMGSEFMPGYLTAAVEYGPVDMAACRGYLWVE